MEETLRIKNPLFAIREKENNITVFYTIKKSSQRDGLSAKKKVIHRTPISITLVDITLVDTSLWLTLGVNQVVNQVDGSRIYGSPTSINSDCLIEVKPQSIL